MCLDIEEEKIHLVCAENITLDTLASKVPEDSARYHLYKFAHTHEGDFMENFGKRNLALKQCVKRFFFSIYLFNAWV